jgi:hypothetical protein
MFVARGAVISPHSRSPRMTTNPLQSGAPASQPTSDALHEAIAAALVQANLSFVTDVGKSGSESVRLYKLLFGASPRQFTVTGYHAGSVLLALTPIRLSDPAKRLQMGDFLSLLMPMARVLPNPPEHPAGDNLAWVEASVPAISGVALPSWVAVSPFMMVSYAMERLLARFNDDLSIPDTQFLLLFATEPAGVPPVMGADEAGTPGQ